MGDRNRKASPAGEVELERIAQCAPHEVDTPLQLVYEHTLDVLRLATHSARVVGSHQADEATPNVRVRAGDSTGGSTGGRR